MARFLKQIFIVYVIFHGVTAVTYTMYRTSQNWKEALDDCWAYNKQLAIVDSSSASANIIGVESGDDVWIGLSDGHTEGVWRWPNGKVASWGNWEPGHPSGGDSKNCAFKKSGNEGYWVSEDCSATKYFICQDETEHDACSDNIVKNGQGSNKECLGYRNASMETSALCHSSYDAVSYRTDTEQECKDWCYLRPDIITTSCSYATSDGRCKMSDADGALSSACSGVTSTTRQYAGNYVAAKSRCTQPKITNADVESIYRQLMVDNGIYQLWIGLTYDTSTGSWKWPDGSYPEGYHNWKDGEPNDNGDECVYLDRNENKWKQSYCTSSYGYTCGLLLDGTCGSVDVSGATWTYDVGASMLVYTCTGSRTFSDNTSVKKIACDCDTDVSTMTADIQAWGACEHLGTNPHCTTDVFDHTGLCYWFEATQVSWQDAWTACFNKDGRLAMMHDEDTSDFVISNLQNQGWIGLTDGVSEGTFRWSNTQAADPTYDRFRSWPSATRNECAYTRTDGEWDISDCGDTRRYFCQSYHASLPIYQCTDLRDGCLGLWPDTWEAADNCVDITVSSVISVGMSQYNGISSLDDCKKLCQQQINFRCRTIQYGSALCVVLAIKMEDIPIAAKLAVCGNVELLKRIPLARDSEICYTAYEEDDSTSASSKTYCENLGQNIYKVTNDREQAVIAGMTDSWSAVQMWETNGQVSFQYRYIDGTYPEYMPWQADEPKYNTNERCVRSQGGDKLAEIDSCSETKDDIICETTVASHCASLTPSDNNADITTKFNKSLNAYITVYACNVGYNFPSTQDTQKTFACGCSDDSSTITISETCQVVDCLSLPTIAHTVWVSGSSTAFNSTIQYRCETGYEPQTIQTVKCQGDSTWTDLPDECTATDCGNPAAISDGSIDSVGGTTFNQIARYICDTGYEFSSGNSMEEITCLANGTWGDMNATCKDVDCGAYPSLPNGQPTPPNATTYNNTVSYQCNTGYKFNNNNAYEEIVCQNNRAWTNIMSTCEEIDCGTPYAISDGSIDSVAGTTYNQIARYICDIGYEFSSGNTVEDIACLANGTWSDMSAICNAVDCGAYPSLPNGQPTPPNATTYNNTVSYQCNTGYKFNNNDTYAQIVCQNNSTWTNILSTCEEIDCGYPPAINNGYVDTKNNTITIYTSYNNVANYTCHYGYTFNINQIHLSSTCEENGLWSNITYPCVRVDCGPLPQIENSTLVSAGGTRYRDKNTFECIEGTMFFQGNINLTITCLGDSTWDETSAACVEIDCGNLPDLLNGSVSISEDTVHATYNSTIEYRCDNGFIFSNNENKTTITCGITGFWSELLTICDRRDCGSVPTVHNGTMQNSEGTKFNDRTSYTCNEGTMISPGVINTVFLCRGDGSWSKPDQTCVDIDCGNTPLLEHGYVYTNNSTINATYQSTVDYYCDNGYVFANNETSISSDCRRNGLWRPLSSTCVTIGTGIPGTAATNYELTTETIANTDQTSTFPELTTETIANLDQTISYSELTTETIANTDQTTSYYELRTETIANIDQTISYSDLTIETIANTDQTTSYSEPTTMTKAKVDQTTIFPGLRCPNPTRLSQSTVTESFPFVGAYAVYQCKKGFEFSDHSSTRTIICLPGATWHTVINSCEAKHCSDIMSSVENAECDSVETHSSVVITCVCEGNNRFITGQSKVRFECSNRRKWSINPGSCKPRCPELPLVKNSHAVWEGVNEPGTGVLIQCDQGHRFPTGEHEKWMMCQNNLEWEDIDYCIIDTCAAIPDAPHRKVNTTQTIFGTVVEVVCDEGYTFYPGIWIIITECQELGIWNLTDIPQCLEISCDLLLSIPNATSIGNGTEYGTSVIYPCINTGTEATYRHTDGYTNKTIICQQNSQWSDTQISCQLGRCEPVPTVENAVPDNILSTSRNLVTYTCNPGYVFDDNVFQQTIQCINGVWNISLHACRILMCPEAPTIGYASPDNTENIYNTVIEYMCTEGYLFYDHEINNNTITIRCGESQAWNLMNVESSDVIPSSCSLQKCGPLPTIAFSQSPVEYSDTYGTVITINCRSGYWVGRDVFTQVLTCSITGEWEPRAQECIEVTCPALAFWTGVHANVTGRHIGAVISATCKNNQENQTRVFTDGSTEKESKCSTEGEWIPDIPDCKDLVPKPVFEPAPTEAENAQNVGIIGIILVSLTLVLILLADLPFLVGELITLRKLLWNYKK